MVAVDYIFLSHSLEDVCQKNAALAREHGRYDHERVFRTLAVLFPASQQTAETEGGAGWTKLAKEVIVKL